ncbi:glucose-6-phosphate isomerase [Flavobacteriaceae bacterium]|jgi:glucose-6-phosphate isomerase|nr:glucose-6-phosphate isomerase [Cryomorphaceae bacterium]MDB3967609.1 glucose-6-phosphate isomerase [Flavobacteriaceae bacterium]
MALSKQNPTTLNSWLSLDKQFKVECNDHISSFFEEKNRLDNFTISWQDFYLDFSKNRLSSTSLELLIDLCTETNLRNNIEKYFNGSAINETEKRSVLHTALRSSEIKNPDLKQEVDDALEKITNISDQINSGIKLGFTGKKITDIVNIGIGGSHLGPEMVTEALSFYSLGINPHFVSNIDPDFTSKLLEKLNPETTVFIIVSKTFTTIETLENAKKIRRWFVENANEESIKDHFIAVSNNTEAPKKFGISSDNVLSIPEWVGGRFSLWGSVGLIISIIIGSKNFKEFLKGAESMDLHFRNSPFEKNIPIILAVISIWYNNFFKCETEAVLPYNQFLGKLPDYLQQASMESNGKSIDRGGNKVNYETGSIIWGSTGTNAQHAFFQLMHQGTKIIPSDFIAFKKSLYGDSKQHDILISNFLAQTNALMMGKNSTGSEIHKNIEGNKPSNSIVINKLTPSSLGALISMYENKIFTIGSVLNIYSYDQWGVELGKSIARDISNGKQDNLDKSTIKISEILKS